MTIASKILDPADVETAHAEASTLMKQGMRLLSDTSHDTVARALDCFDRARELRARLPFERVPLLRYGLAACWLNRADALMRLAEAEAISLALAAYDEALALLRDLPLADDPRFPRRLAIAHHNRGLALRAQGAPVEHTLAAFGDAIAILDADPAASITDRSYLLAAVWVNLAGTRASETTDESEGRAREAALRAIALVRDLELNDADAAHVGLSARHVLCQAIAKRLSLAITDEDATISIHDATDVVDEALSLVRHWERHGIARFRGVAHDLFRFGVRVYARYQPHFLNEFVLENVDASQSSSAYVHSAEIRSAADEAFALARRADTSTDRGAAPRPRDHREQRARS